MQDKTALRKCLRNPLVRRVPAFALAVCVSASALAASTTLSGTSPASISAGKLPQTLNFPVTRTGDKTYPVVLSYHTQNVTALSGKDYTGSGNSITLPSGASSINIPITILPDSGNPPFNTFKVLLDGATLGTLPTFGTQQVFTTGTTPFSIGIADFNGDGLLDLIVANGSANNISVLLNTTAPGAAAPVYTTQQTFATGLNPKAVSVADINGDGLLDIIVSNAGDNTVSVLFNTTVPGALVASFAAQQSFATGNSPGAISVADLNGDGKSDLIVANSGSGNVSVLLNTTTPGAATPSFAVQQTFATGSNPSAVATADINGDGEPDLIVANNGSGNVSVLLNTTTPGATTLSFAAQQTSATGANPTSVAVADLNGDGALDLAVANSASGTVSVLFNIAATGAATPSFSAQQTFAVEAAPTSVAAVDINGDGKPDLLVANGGANTASVLLNVTIPGAATAGFAAEQSFAAGTNPVAISAADINRDGQPDLVVTNAGSGTVSVLLNTAVASNIAPGFAAKQDFASAYDPVGLGVPGYVTAADINGDGKPDLIVADGDNFGVFINTTIPGSATATYAARQIFAIGTTVSIFAMADINGDGKLDVVAVSASQDASHVGQIMLSINTTAAGAGSPSFAAPQIFPTGLDPRSAISIDINGDGKPDVITANRNANTISVLLNTTVTGAATGSFAAQQTFATGTNPISVTAADINGDGKPDLIVANSSVGTISILLNTTPPGAAVPSFAVQQTFATGSNPQQIISADINGDGKPDLITVDSSGNTVSVLLNNTVPGSLMASFGIKQSFAAGSLPLAIAVADLNGDGKPDLIAANYSYSASGGTISVLRNTTASGATSASFAALQSSAVGIGTLSVAVADLNGDGKPDIVVANGDNASKSLSVLLNAAQCLITGTTPIGTIAHDIIYIDGFGFAPAN